MNQAIKMSLQVAIKYKVEFCKASFKTIKLHKQNIQENGVNTNWCLPLNNCVMHAIHTCHLVWCRIVVNTKHMILIG